MEIRKNNNTSKIMIEKPQEVEFIGVSMSFGELEVTYLLYPILIYKEDITIDSFIEDILVELTLGNEVISNIGKDKPDCLKYAYYLRNRVKKALRGGTPIWKTVMHKLYAQTVRFEEGKKYPFNSIIVTEKKLFGGDPDYRERKSEQRKKENEKVIILYTSKEWKVVKNLNAWEYQNDPDYFTTIPLSKIDEAKVEEEQ